MKPNPTILVVDLFCGAGGTTTGFEAVPEALVIACVNHDHKAIKSHWENYPHVKHFNEDIRTLDLSELINLTEHNRNLFPEAKLILWASLECTNFSKAKGGKPRDADSRTLADHLDRYILALNPDYIQIENVVEFMSWGPLDKNGKPVSRKNGQSWMQWRNRLCEMGYYDEWQQLNSADFGAYTSRNRLFGIFAKHHLPVSFPQPTHAKKPRNGSLFDNLKPWKAVKDVLDFEDKGQSIFNRKKALSDNTLERIYAGLVKYVANGEDSFIKKYFSGRPAGKVASTNSPLGTITTVDHQALVQPAFLAAYYGNGDNISSLEHPCPTIPTKDRFKLIQVKGSNIQSVNEPAGTIMPVDKHVLITTQPFILKYNSINGKTGKHVPPSINDPLPVISCQGRLGVVQPFVMPTNYKNGPKSIEEPLQVITANRKHHYLVQAESGKFSIPVYEGDSEVTVRIKVFMAAYNIQDIYMRMLRVDELLSAQGFPRNYRLVGNQTDHKKFIGNSVVPKVVTAWTRALIIKLNNTPVRKVA